MLCTVGDEAHRVLRVMAVVDLPKVRGVVVDVISRESLGRFIRGDVERSFGGGFGDASVGPPHS